MPITLHKPSVLYEMENHELMNHIDDLTEFIEIFTGENIQDLANQIRDLKAENKILKSKSYKHYEAMEKLIENEGKRVEIVFKKLTKRDNQIKERDNQIKERDNQIKELLQEIGTGKKLLNESKEWGTKLVEEMEKIKKECCSKENYDIVYKENEKLKEKLKISELHVHKLINENGKLRDDLYKFKKAASIFF